MAESIRFEVALTPRNTLTKETLAPEGGKRVTAVLSTTDSDAIKLLMTHLAAGTDISSVVTAINAL